MLTIESEPFKIDMPDEIGEYSQGLYSSLVEKIPAREGLTVKFETISLARRVVNDLCILAERDKYSVFSEKVKKTHHRRLYLRPTSESKS